MTAELLMRRLVHQGRQQSIVAVFAVVLAVILTGAASCSRDGDSRIPSGAIVRVGDSWLTRSDLRREMPAGLSAEDSLKFVRAYIAGWVDSRLISELASSDVDMDEIDRLTADYRTEWIMNGRRCRRRLFCRGQPEGILRSIPCRFRDSAPNGTRCLC